jgi:hypothetical protein
MAARPQALGPATGGRLGGGTALDLARSRCRAGGERSCLIAIAVAPDALSHVNAVMEDMLCYPPPAAPPPVGPRQPRHAAAASSGPRQWRAAPTLCRPSTWSSLAAARAWGAPWRRGSCGKETLWSSAAATVRHSPSPLVPSLRPRCCPPGFAAPVFSQEALTGAATQPPALGCVDTLLRTGPPCCPIAHTLHVATAYACLPPSSRCITAFLPTGPS